MPYENETGISREDAQSAAESLFGDTTTDQTVSVAEGEYGNNETEPDSQGSEAGEDQVLGEENGSPEDLKVVVSIRSGRGSIGVQRPSSDPHIELFEDRGVSELAQEVRAVLERARVKWEETPKYPAHERPAPPAKRRTRREQRSAQASTAVEGESDQQQPEALRLF